MNDKHLTELPRHLVEKFMGIVRRTAELENRPWHFGTDETLFRSEIFLLELIGDQEGVGVTDAANLLGITKGAVSQTLKKLDAKGLVEKRSDPINSLKACLYLTNKGKIAFYAHKHWHETMDGGFKDYFSRLSQENISFLDEFLNQLDAFLNKWEESLDERSKISNY
jgi:DNA-binding MarR family transcriptional regulator